MSQASPGHQEGSLVITREIYAVSSEYDPTSKFTDAIWEKHYLPALGDQIVSQNTPIQSDPKFR